MNYVLIWPGRNIFNKKRPTRESWAERGARTGTKRRNRQHGFTLTEIMIVVAIIGLLLAIVVPNYVRARLTTQANACISNLKNIHWAKSQWAFEYRKKNTDTPTEAELSPYFNEQKMPTCPGGGIYRINEVADPPRCSLRDEGHVWSGGPPDHAVANGWRN